MEHSVINNILKRLARHKRGLVAHTIMHPAREWWIWISVSLVVVAVAASWGAFLFTSYDKEFISTDPVPVRIPYKAETITAALEKYRERRAEFNEGEYLVPVEDAKPTEILEPQPATSPEPTPEPSVPADVDTSAVLPAI